MKTTTASSKHLALATASIALLLHFAVGTESKDKHGPMERIIEIEAGLDFKFSIVEIQAIPGEALCIHFRNSAPSPSSEVLHNVAFLDHKLTEEELVEATMIVKEDMSIPDEIKDICIGSTPNIGPGGEYQLKLTVPNETGQYSFICAVPGHTFLGMKGVLIVE